LLLSLLRIQGSNENPNKGCTLLAKNINFIKETYWLQPLAPHHWALYVQALKFEDVDMYVTFKNNSSAQTTYKEQET